MRSVPVGQQAANRLAPAWTATANRPALREGTEFVNGQSKDTNLNSYAVLRMGDVPDVEIEFLPSAEAPVGPGEPATTAVPPAIGNAIFATTGARVRHTPVQPHDVLHALAGRDST